MANPRSIEEVEAAIDELVERYRDTCLWFLDPAFRASSEAARRRVLDHIARHGDREAFVRATELRSWLSRPSSARSVGS